MKKKIILLQIKKRKNHPIKSFKIIPKMILMQIKNNKKAKKKFKAKNI